jgi:hypothetical protein
MFKSKKADAVVTVLVLLTLLLVSFSLFKFLTSKWAGEESVSNSYALEDFYSEQDNVIFLMKEVSRGIVESGGVTKESFVEQFKSKFKKNAEKFPELEPYALVVENGDYNDTKIENNRLFFSLGGFESSGMIKTISKIEDSQIKYKTRVVFEIGF